MLIFSHLRSDALTIRERTAESLKRETLRYPAARCHPESDEGSRSELLNARLSRYTLNRKAKYQGEIPLPRLRARNDNLGDSPVPPFQIPISNF
jgi:hypothetical protein